MVTQNFNSEVTYNDFGKFILRTPVFSFNEFELIYDETISFDDKLRFFLKDPIIREAIYLASPSLYHSCKKWIDGTLSNNRKIIKLKSSLLKYLVRMCTRSTPFGLFAGISFGKLSDQSQISFLSNVHYVRYSRLDMTYLFALYQSELKTRYIKSVKFYTNSSLYCFENICRYVDYSYNVSKLHYKLVELKLDKYSKSIIKICNKGASFSELYVRIKQINNSLSVTEIEQYILSLIQGNIITSEIEPNLTGLDYGNRIQQITSSYPINGINKTIKEQLKTLKQIDKKQLGKGLADYIRLSEEIDNSGNSKIEYKFQVDLFKPTKSAKLNKKISNEVLDAIKLLVKLNSYVDVKSIIKFKEAFIERYEYQQIPLLEVLDMEYGIGYGNNYKFINDQLLGDINLRYEKKSKNITWNKKDSFLFELYLSALQNGEDVVELKEKDFLNFSNNLNQFSSTISAMISLLDSENVLLKFVSSGSAANLINRFYHTDKKIYELLQEIVKKEEEMTPSNSIIAEIVHIPQDIRVCNVLKRPMIRQFEVPFLSYTINNEKNQIKLCDILILVRNDKIILYSTKLKKEIIPILSTAHNFYINSHPIYNFLCDLQTQNNKLSLSFNWGPLSDEYKFLPRVKFKNVILSSAVWNFKVIEIDNLFQIDNNLLLDECGRWRDKYRVPDKVFLVDGDNELFIDFTNIYFIKMFISEVKYKTRFKLIEFLFKPSEIPINFKGKNYLNEIIIPFYRTNNHAERY